MAEIDNDLLKCALCLDTFTDPRALPCLHTFCGGCLEAMVKGNFGRNINCPLCQESHFVPTNGIHGFRQDFRIKSICESIKKMKLKCPENNSNKVDKCKVHIDMEVLFYCRTSSCNEAICGRCWAEKHNQHTVVSLSEEVLAVESKIKISSETYVKTISNYMKSLEVAKEDLNKKQQDVRKVVDEYIAKCHADLVNKGNQVCNAANGIIESERKKVSEALSNMGNMISICNLVTNTKHDKVQSKLSKLMEVQKSVDSFKMQIKSPTLTTKPLLLNVFEMKVKEENLDLPALNKHDTKKGFEEICQTDVFMKPATPASTTNTPKSGVSTRSRSTSRSRKPGGGSTSRSHTPSPARPPIKSLMHIPSPSHHCYGSPFSNMEPSLPAVEVVLRERWYQEYIALGGIAIRRNGFVYLAVHDGIDVYTRFGKKLHGDMHSCNGDDSADIAFIKSRNREYLTELDNKNEELRIYCDSCTPDNFNDHIFNMKTRMGTSFSLATTDNHVLYTYERHGVVQIACLNTAQFPLIFRCNMNTDIIRHRSMTAMENPSGMLTVVASSYHPNANRQFGIAIQAVTDLNYIAWEVTWDQIDAQASTFDLIAMETDGMNIYVLNKMLGCVYLLSQTGQCHGKVLTGLTRPTHMSISSEGRHLALVEDFKQVLVYSLHY